MRCWAPQKVRCSATSTDELVCCSRLGPPCSSSLCTASPLRSSPLRALRRLCCRSTCTGCNLSCVLRADDDGADDGGDEVAPAAAPGDATGVSSVTDSAAGAPAPQAASKQASLSIPKVSSKSFDAFPRVYAVRRASRKGLAPQAASKQADIVCLKLDHEICAAAVMWRGRPAGPHPHHKHCVALHCIAW